MRLLLILILPACLLILQGCKEPRRVSAAQFTQQLEQIVQHKQIGKVLGTRDGRAWLETTQSSGQNERVVVFVPLDELDAHTHVQLMMHAQQAI